MPPSSNYRPSRHGLLWAVMLLLSALHAHAATPLSIGKALYNAKTQTLTVTTKIKGAAGALTILHGGGGILATRDVSGDGQQNIDIPLNPSIDTPCMVEARLGDLAVSKKVKGAPAACAKAPECKILLPQSPFNVQANTPVQFKGQAKLKDKQAAPLSLEWDFAGGSMGEEIPGTHPVAYKRPDTADTTVQFVRDNASYRVRFTAWDKLNRYCEASVMVNVGTPPTNLPDISALATEAQQSAPALGSQLAGNKDDVVVLPFAELTMPGTGDYRYTPNVEMVTIDAAFNTLNAVAYSKERLPVLLDNTQLALKYSAASNPSDPVGVNSINSTSQNWPLNPDISKASPLLSASIQKTDMWEVFQRPSSDLLAPSYVTGNWASHKVGTFLVSLGRYVGPDEGFILAATPGIFNPPADALGRYMPGRNAPYSANDLQDFTSYYANEQRHIARAIPLTDIDDAGRVNPLPLLRVSAIDKNTGKTLASSDAVVGTAKDVHCRECHAKGKIGANDKFDWNSIPQAFHSSKFYGENQSRLASGCAYVEPYCTNGFSPPVFFDSVDGNGQASDNIFDQEYAANKNIGTLHDFYDWTEEFAWREGRPLANGSGYSRDAQDRCGYCHRSRITGTEIGQPFVYNWPGFRGAGQPTDSNSTMSEVIHNFHEQLQQDPNDSNKVLRDAKGRPKLWDPATGPNPYTLFPTVDSQGNALPMEQNCLRCHGGHREPLYRDRMYTAGVTCYDCHGDMKAVGSAFAKSKPGTGGDVHRLGWFEQPDCGSCHTGNANQGKDGKNGFFSAGVMKRAFNTDDRSATTRTPPSKRFAVQVGKPITNFGVDSEVLPGPVRYKDRNYIRTVTLPLYRNSKDTHGNVACASCHGGAHENWPMRDPKSNDNVTAKQLQGHSGPILECNVCHTSDSFKNEDDLDGGIYSGDTVSGILGGPHNTHPINDPYWWKSTEGDSANADSTLYGGWHNNYAKKPGEYNEDQCAACHGNDHKGTRLSKTPVDRVFDFSGFDFKKLKKAGFKSKIIKVAAGTEIGCDTCHSVATSCIGSPSPDCGKASDFVPVNANRDPVITSMPGETTAVMGQPYRYQVLASDPDGDALTYSLGYRPTNPDTMSISETGLVTYTWPESAIASYPQGPLTFPYTVTVTDGKGGHTTQTVNMTLSCPTGRSWAWNSSARKGECELDSVGAIITSPPTVTGLSAGGAYSYPVAATSDKGLPLSYTLSGQPEGMTIDATNGLINWQTDTATSGVFSFKVAATDTSGGYGFQNVSVTVCKSTQVWHGDHGMCM